MSCLSRNCVDHQIDGSALIPKRSAKQRFRQQIFDAWQHSCAYCGVPADTLDHVKPRHKGGNTVTNNLVPACRECNRHKGSDDWREWFTAQSFHCIIREQRVASWLASIDHQGSNYELG